MCLMFFRANWVNQKILEQAEQLEIMSSLCSSLSVLFRPHHQGRKGKRGGRGGGWYSVYLACVFSVIPAWFSFVLGIRWCVSKLHLIAVSCGFGMFDRVWSNKNCFVSVISVYCVLLPVSLSSVLSFSFSFSFSSSSSSSFSSSSSPPPPPAKCLQPQRAH